MISHIAETQLLGCVRRLLWMHSMHRCVVVTAFSSLLFAAPVRADAARDGSSVAVQQQAEVPAPPTSEPNGANIENVQKPGPHGPVRFTDRPFSVNVMFGAGSIVGGLGGVVEYSLTSRVALGGGLGATWISHGQTLGALQGGGFGRFRFALDEGNSVAQAFGLVAGFSTGRFEYPLFSGDASSVSEQAYWVQLGMGYELVTRGGFSFAGEVGAAILAGTSGVQDYYSDSAPLDHSTLPRLFLDFDLSVGWAI